MTKAAALRSFPGRRARMFCALPPGGVGRKGYCMISIVYASDAVDPYSSDQLADLLAVSRRNNTARGLTGLLLYKDGQFMQVLEGDDADVSALLAVIEGDPRHTDVRTLLTESIEERRFPHWSMGFASASDLAGLDGYRDFFGARDGGDHGGPSRARLLLDWFRFHRIASPSPASPGRAPTDAVG